MVIQQNTPEWLEMRKRYIGASDAPVIMGVSPWKNEYELWEEKVGMRNPPPINRAMKYGIDNEEKARIAYEMETGNFVKPKIVFHPEYSFAMASLDGISEDESIAVEIKCPGKKDHEVAFSGKVPQKYYPQLQHQLFVTNLQKMHYFSYTEESVALVEVERDEKYIADLIEKEMAFWQKVCDFEPPEPPIKERTDADFRDIAEKWKEVNRILKNWQAQEKELREQLLALSEGENCIGFGVEIKKIVSKGSIDYKSIPELQEIDMEQYRKNAVVKWKISIK